MITGLFAVGGIWLVLLTSIIAIAVGRLTHLEDIVSAMRRSAEESAKRRCCDVCGEPATATCGNRDKSGCLVIRKFCDIHLQIAMQEAAAEADDDDDGEAWKRA